MKFAVSRGLQTEGLLAPGEEPRCGPFRELNYFGQGSPLVFIIPSNYLLLFRAKELVKLVCDECWVPNMVLTRTA